MQMQSDSIDQLAAALAAAQADLKPVARDSQASTGAFTYTYSSLAIVLKAVRPVLNRHGLAVIQVVVPRVEPILAETIERKRDRDGNWVEQHVPLQSLGSVRTILAHTSGQWIASDVPILASWGDVQAVGAAVTYFRRIALKAIVGLAEVDDTDGKLPQSGERDRSRRRSDASASRRHEPRSDPRAVALEMNRVNSATAGESPGAPGPPAAAEPACPPDIRRYWRDRGLDSEVVELAHTMGLHGRASEWAKEDRFALHDAMRNAYPDVMVSRSERDVPF
jgi:hypothetical protein